MDDRKYIYRSTSQGIKAFPVIRETDNCWIIPLSYTAYRGRQKYRYVNKKSKSWSTSVGNLEIDSILKHVQNSIESLEKRKKKVDDKLLTMRMCKDFVLEDHTKEELLAFLVRMEYLEVCGEKNYRDVTQGRKNG